MCSQVLVIVYQLYWETFTRLTWFTQQVMLMASPSMEDLYHKSCALAEDPQELRDGFQHPARLVKVNMPDTLGSEDWLCQKGKSL